MVKSRSLLLIISGILLVALSALATFFGLSAVGIIETGTESLVIELLDNEQEYDGSSITASGYEITEGELATGHSLVVTYKGSQVDVGTSICSAEINVLDSNGNNVTDEYAITCKDATLQVTPRQIKIAPEESTKQYDGSVITGSDFNILSGTLVNGDTIQPTFNVIDENSSVGEYTCEISCLIFNTAGIDVSKNYNISYNTAIIQIISQPITISTKSVEKFYDGKSNDDIFDYQIISGKLGDGHTVEAFYEPLTNTNVGEYDIKFDKVSIYDEEHHDVSSNYTIFYQNTGKLTIKSIEATIEALAPSVLEHEYNEESYEHDRETLYRLYSVNNVPSSKLIEENDYIYINVKYFDKDHKELKDSQGNATTPVEAGKYYVQYVGASVYRLNVDAGYTTIDLSDPNSYIDVSDNYSFNIINLYDQYEYEILKKEIVFGTLDQASKTYNREELTDSEKYDSTKYEIVSGDELLTDIEKQSFEVEVEYKLNGEVVNPVNAGEYSIFVKNVIDPSNLLSKNYEVKYFEEGSLFIIEKAIISLSITDATRPYDGKLEEYGKNFEIISGELTDEEKNQLLVKLAYTLDGKQVEAIDAGQYKAYIVGTNDALTANYEFKYSDTEANYNINKIEAYVIPSMSIQTEYSSKEVKYDSNNYKVLDEQFNVIDLDLGNVEFEILYYLLSENNEAIAVEHAIDAGKYIVVFTGLKDGFNEESTLAKNYDIKFLPYETIEYDESLQSILEITKVKGQLSIETIMPNEKYKVYDGKEYVHLMSNFKIIDTIYSEKAFLRENDQLYVITEYYDSKGKLLEENQYPKDAGKYTVKIKDVKIYRALIEDGFDKVDLGNEESYKEVTPTYNLVKDYLIKEYEYEIKKKEIVFGTLDQKSKIYDGKELSDSEKYDPTKYEIISGAELLTDIEKQSFQVEVEYKLNDEVVNNPINAGEYSIFVKNVIDSSNLLSKNYEVKYSEEGSLFVIEKAEIGLRITDATRPYDGKLEEYGKNFEIISGELTDEERSQLLVKLAYTLGGNQVEAIDAGQYKASIVGTNDALTNNYNFTYSNIEEDYTITKKFIYITSAVNEVIEYSSMGYEHNFSSYKVLDEQFNVIDLDLGNVEFNINYHTYNTRTDSFNSISQRDAIDTGKYLIIFTGFKTGLDDESTLAKNYDINFLSYDDVKDNANLQNILEIEAIKDALAIESIIPSEKFKEYDSKEYRHDYDSYRIIDTNYYESTFVRTNDELYLVVEYYDSNGELLPVDEYPKNAGKYTIKIKDAKIYRALIEDEFDRIDIDNPASYKDVTSAYNLVKYDVVKEYEYEIKKKEIVFGTVDQTSKRYDGKELSDFEKYDPTEYEILSGDELLIESLKGSFKVEVKYVLNGEVVNNPINAGEYSIFVKNVIDEYNLLSKNYEVKYSEEGSLFVINKKEVSIDLDVEFETYIYDGTFKTYAPKIDGLELGDEENVIVVVKYFTEEGTEVEKPINVGKYTVKIDSVTQIIENYIIDLSDNDEKDFCQINKLDIEFIVDDISKMFDGTDLKYEIEGVSISEDLNSVGDHYKLISGHEMQKLMYEDEDAIYRISNAIEDEETSTEWQLDALKVIIVDDAGNDVSNNYNQTFKHANGVNTYLKAEFTPITAAFSFGKIEKVYDGLDFRIATMYSPSLPGIEEDFYAPYFDVKWENQFLAPSGTVYFIDCDEFIDNTDAMEEYESLYCEPVFYYPINNMYYDITDLFIEFDYNTSPEYIIKKADLTIEILDYQKYYDGEVIDSSNLHCSYIGSAAEKYRYYDSIEIECNESEVGTYKLEIDINDYEDSNFNISVRAGVATILPSNISISVFSQVKTFDGEEYNFDSLQSDDKYYISGVGSDEFKKENGDDILLTCAASDVGTHAISCSFDPQVNKNFNVTVIPGTLTINPAPITINVFSHVKTFDGEEVDLTDQFEVLGTQSSLYDSSNVILSCDGINVGTYTISCEVDDPEDDNFVVTVIPGTLTINPASVIITIVNVSKVYDGQVFPNELLTHKITGNGRNAYDGDVILECYKVDAGIHKIEYNEDLNDNENFDVSVVEGYVTIIPAEVTVVPTSVSKVYDGEPYSNEFKYEIYGQSVEAFKSLVNIDVSCVDTEVGSHLITLEIEGSYNDNFIVNEAEGYVTITKANISITPINVTKVYDNKECSFSYVLSGESVDLYEGEIEILCDGSGLDVGEYDLEVIADDDSNFNISCNTAKLIITPANIVITGLNVTKVYDGDVYTSESAYIISGDSVSAYTGSVEVSCSDIDCGTYDLELSFEEDSNFEISYVNGQITILKAQATIVVEGATIEAGEPFEPNYEIICDDSILSEIMVYTEEVTYNTPGVYNLFVTFERNDNIVINVIPGTLIVE